MGRRAIQFFLESTTLGRTTLDCQRVRMARLAPTGNTAFPTMQGKITLGSGLPDIYPNWSLQSMPFLVARQRPSSTARQGPASRITATCTLCIIRSGRFFFQHLRFYGPRHIAVANVSSPYIRQLNSAGYNDKNMRPFSLATRPVASSNDSWGARQSQTSWSAGRDFGGI